MQNVLWVLILAAGTIVLFRHNRNADVRSILQEVLHVGEEFDESVRAYSKCTLSSCFDLQRCMLEYDFLSVYIEPLINIVSENGTVISPVPSREFLELRQSLLPYAVGSPNNSCIVVPGIDFLNVNRFNSSSHLNLVVNHVLQKYKNVLVFTMTPVSAFSRAIIASPSPFSTLFRHQFDISIPLFPHTTDVTKSVQKDVRRILLPLINASTSVITEYMELTQAVEGLYFVSECNENITSLCDKDGHRLEKSLEQLIMISDTIILDGDIPLFPHLISLVFKHGVIPVIVSRGRILPFSPIQDWSRISASAVAVQRIPYLLEKLDKNKKDQLRMDVQRYHNRHFSSISSIIKDMMAILSYRILPTQQMALAEYFHNYTNEIGHVIPHISLSEKVNVILLPTSYDRKSLGETLNSICALTSVESITVFLDETEFPSELAHSCTHDIQIILGNPNGNNINNLVQRSNSTSQAYLISRKLFFDISDEQLNDSISIWRAAPHQITKIYSTKDCTMELYHKTLLHRVFE